MFLGDTTLREEHRGWGYGYPEGHYYDEYDYYSGSIQDIVFHARDPFENVAFFMVLIPIWRYWIMMPIYLKACLVQSGRWFRSNVRCCRSNAPTVVDGKQQSGQTGKNTKGKVNKSSGAFKPLEELDMKETQIASFDAVCHEVGEVANSIVKVNTDVIDLAANFRDDAGGEDELPWKDFVAKKVRDGVSEALCACAAETQKTLSKALIPSFNLSGLASGELKITMPERSKIEDLGGSSEIVKVFEDFKELAEGLVEIVTGNMPVIASDVANAVEEVSSIDFASLQGEVTEHVGNNPFTIMSTVKAMKANVSKALGIKTVMESLIHNITVLVEGLKDGICKGLQDAKASAAKGVQDAQICDEPHRKLNVG